MGGAGPGAPRAGGRGASTAPAIARRRGTPCAAVPRARAPRGWRTKGAVGVALGALLCGCHGKVTGEDCERAAKALARVWQQEVAAGAASAGAFAYHAGRQGDSLESGFRVRCRAELVGKPLAGGEVSCLVDARSLADVGRCAAP